MLPRQIATPPLKLLSATVYSNAFVEPSLPLESESTPPDYVEDVQASSPPPQKQQSESAPLDSKVDAQTTSPLPPAPDHIDAKHWHELVAKSAIAPDVARLNFKSLHVDPVEQEHRAWEFLLYSQKIPRRNDGRLRNYYLNKYKHIEQGGWWCNGGVDPRCFALLQSGEQPMQKLWGCYKPNQPRYEKKNKKKKFIWPWEAKPALDELPPAPDELKLVKYESPPKTALSIFLLDVPDEIANKVYSKAGVDPTTSDRVSGFWYCVWKYNVPILVTEGAKKTAAMLSQGDAVIGLSGINGAYRVYDDQKNPITPHLRPEFAVFATTGRDIKICFDYEIKPNTKKNVFLAIAKTGKLLEAAGANVSVVSLPGPEKGIDDFIVAHGSKPYQQLLTEALPLESWQQKYPPPDLRLVLFLKNGKQLWIKDTYKDITIGIDNQDNNTIFQKCFKLSLFESNSSLVTTEPFSWALIPIIKTKEQEPTSQKNSLFEPQLLPESEADKSWSKRQQVTIYEKTFPRKLLLAKENQEIAKAAYQLVKTYGVKTAQDSNDLVYRADAFIIGT